jgi:hypothetical protein
MLLITRRAPQRFHQRFNRPRGRAEFGNSLTLHRFNMTEDVKALASRTGSHVLHIEWLKLRPNYIRTSSITSLLCITYEKLVNRFAGLLRFRIPLISHLEKRSDITP